jgi:hypothetical protein
MAATDWLSNIEGKKGRMALEQATSSFRLGIEEEALLPLTDRNLGNL